MKKSIILLGLAATIISCTKQNELEKDVLTDEQFNVKVISNNNENTRSTTGVTIKGNGTYVWGADVDVIISADPTYYIKSFSLISGTETSHSHSSSQAKATIKSIKSNVIYNVEVLSNPIMTIQTTNGGSVSKTSINNTRPGEQVSIIATPFAGYVFDKWEVSSGDATIKNPTYESTTITINSTNSTIIAKFKSSVLVIDKLYTTSTNISGQTVYHLYIQASEPVLWEGSITMWGEITKYVWNGYDDEIVSQSQSQLGVTINREATKSNVVDFIPSTGTAKYDAHTDTYYINNSVIRWEENTDYIIGRDEWSGLVDIYAPR